MSEFSVHHCCQILAVEDLLGVLNVEQVAVQDHDIGVLADPLTIDWSLLGFRSVCLRAAKYRRGV